MRARACVRASSLRGAREQAPPHRRGGGAKLQNIVSHRSACKLPGIYLIRGQSVYTRLPFRGREKCPREERASKRCSASVAALLVFFFSFFFFYPTNSVAGIPRFRGESRCFRYYILKILLLHTHKEIRMSRPIQLCPRKRQFTLRFHPGCEFKSNDCAYNNGETIN